MAWSTYQEFVGGATSYTGVAAPVTTLGFGGGATNYTGITAPVTTLGFRGGDSSYIGVAAPMTTLELGSGGGPTSYTGVAAPATTLELGFGGVTAADPTTTHVVGGGAVWYGDVVRYEGAGAPRGGKFSDTLIIFDYDDTLLCSTAIDRTTAEQLRSLETAVEAILLKAMSLGETIIVTNGCEAWFQDSSRQFLPKVQPLLSRLKVISARDMYEYSLPGQPFAWKEAAFAEILAERYEGKSALSSNLNLIVLGDSLQEIDAAHIATANLQCVPLVKTVKFKEFPSADELLGELQLVTQRLAKIVLDDASNTQTLYQFGASGWRIAESRTDYGFSGFDAQSLPFAGA